MTNKDDFFRLTFRRCEPEIEKFEKNIDNVCKGIGLSRPFLVARMCNYLFEKGVEISFGSGEWIISAGEVEPVSESRKSVTDVGEKSRSINLTHTSSASISADNMTGVNTQATDADMDEMLRAMGM